CILFQTNAEIANLVSSNENIIGYISLGYLSMIEGMVNTPKIHADKDSEAVAPSFESVKSKEYPISRDLYIYADENRLSEIAKAYLDFIYTPSGQQIGQQNGFVPIK
ncbi:MAG: substrate-binding domain-containing protein, partial [Actinobacteria bacterium]|nr:substrate-binding domain-containing protein [Actinomycetota bacterium]